MAQALGTISDGVSTLTNPENPTALKPNATKPSNMGKGVNVLAVPGHVSAVIRDSSEIAGANHYESPESVEISVTSNGNAGAAATKTSLFNEGIFVPVRNNGSGALSIIPVYDDGTVDGKLTTLALIRQRANMGAICKGIEIRVTNASDLAVMKPAFINYSASKRVTRTVELKINTNQTRKDNDKTVAVIPCNFNLSEMGDFEYTHPNPGAVGGTNNTIDFVFYFDDNFSR